MFKYAAEVTRIVDGDTIDLSVDLGFGISIKERFRLAGINTPEIHGVKKDSEEYNRGMQAMEYLCKTIPIGTKVEIETIKDQKEKYGRYLAEIHFMDGQARKNLNKTLIELNLAEEKEY